MVFTRLEGVWRWGLTSAILPIKYPVLSFAMEKCAPTKPDLAEGMRQEFFGVGKIKCFDLP